MANVGTLSIKFTGDARELEKTFTRVAVKGNLFAAAIQSGLKGAVGAASDFVKSAVGIATENEKTLTSFKNLTGSISEAKELYRDLLQFSSQTPFSSKEIQSGATTLLGFGLSAKEATQAIKDLGAAAASNADTDLKRLVVSYGQIQGANVAMTKDLREFVNNGIPIYQLLADNLGVTTSKINEMASAGKLTGDVITKVFRDAASEGGRFSNTLISQSQTFQGLVSTMRDNYAITLGEIGNKLLPIAKEAAKGFNNVLLDLQDFFQSDEGEQWAIRIAAGVRAGFETAGTEVKRFLLEAELAFQKTVAVFGGFSQAAQTRIIALEAALDGLSQTSTSFGEAFQQALNDIKFDQSLSNLNEMIDLLDGKKGGKGGAGGGTVISTANDDLLEFITKAEEAKIKLIQLQRIRDEIAKKLADADVGPRVEQLGGTPGAAPLSLRDFDTTQTLSEVEEINSKTLALERQAAAQKKLNDVISAAQSVAATYGSKLQQAYDQGATGARAFASAAVEAAKEVIGAQIREGVVTAVSKALQGVPFPFNIIAAGVAGGAAQALFNSLVSKIKIPAFGDGGVVYGPTLALIGEKGPEEIVPLGKGRNNRPIPVNIRGVQYGIDTYWQNANVGIAGRMIYGPQ